jgi:hypothetical protein
MKRLMSTIVLCAFPLLTYAQSNPVRDQHRTRFDHVQWEMVRVYGVVLGLTQVHDAAHTRPRYPVFLGDHRQTHAEAVTARGAAIGGLSKVMPTRCGRTNWITTSFDLLTGYLIVNIADQGECMDTRTILADLKAELYRLNQAIAALESLDSTITAMPRATTPAAKAAPTQAKKRGLTPAGRRRLSAIMKARWAARRKAAAKPSSKQAPGRRKMSPASRKKIADAQRKRWAAVKKAKTA